VKERCLLVGLGQIGMGYDSDLVQTESVASHALALSRHPEFELVGGVDPSSACRENFTQKYNKRSFEQIEEALDVLSPSIVVIATPTSSHYSVLCKILKSSRPKIILCEKPLDFDLASAQAMVDLCRESGAELFVNYIRRSDPGVIEIKERILSGQIELPLKAVVWYSKGLKNNGSHFLNLLEFWLGNLVQSQVISIGRKWEGLDPEPDFIAVFENGSAIFCAAKEEEFSHYTVELISPSGRLYYSQGGQQIDWQSVTEDLDFPGYRALDANAEVIGNDFARYQYNVLEQLSKALRKAPSFLSTGEDALVTLRNISKITCEIK